MSRRTQQRLEEHVELAEQYPFLKRAGWTRRLAIEAGAKLGQYPEADRGRVAAMLDGDGCPPETAFRLLDNMLTKSPKERHAILDQAESPSRTRRNEAYSVATAVPPMPDPALSCWQEAVHRLRDGARLTDLGQVKALAKQRMEELEADLANIRQWDKEARTL